MKKNMDKLLIIVFCIALVCPIYASANTNSVKISYKKIDQTVKNEYGKFENYYKYPVIVSPTKAQQKINAYILKIGKKRLLSKQEAEEELTNAGTSWNRQDIWFANTINSVVSYANKGFLSIKSHYTWSEGGIVIDDDYGYVFNLKTGKRLNIFDFALSQNFSEIREEIYDKLVEDYPTNDGSGWYPPTNFLDKYKTKLDIKKINFYLDKSGKIVVSFPKYDVTNGNINVTIPSKLSKQTNKSNAKYKCICVDNSPKNVNGVNCAATYNNGFYSFTGVKNGKKVFDLESESNAIITNGKIVFYIDCDVTWWRIVKMDLKTKKSEILYTEYELKGMPSLCKYKGKKIYFILDKSSKYVFDMGKNTTYKVGDVDLQKITNEILNYYARKYDYDKFVISDSEVEYLGDNKYFFILRDQGRREANVLVMWIKVDVSTGKVTDENGEKWKL